MNYDNNPAIQALLGDDSMLSLKQLKSLLETKQHQLMQELGIYIGSGSQLFGEHIYFGPYTRINNIWINAELAPCIIKGHCNMGYSIHISTFNHDIGVPAFQVPADNQNGLRVFTSRKGPAVVIGYSVWVGNCAIILSGVEVGNGAVIGAGAVVTRNVPPYSVVSGSPAREAKKRFSDKIISQLQEIKWWNWSKQKMVRNKVFFETNLAENPDLDLSTIIVP